MQLINTFRLAVEEEDDPLSKSSVCERVIFFLWPPNPKEWRDLGRPQLSVKPVDGDVVAGVSGLFPFVSVLWVS